MDKKGFFLAQMQIEDLPQVMAIENVAFASPWQQQTFYQELTKNRFAHYKVIKKDKELVAYIGYWVVFENIHITTLAVKTEFKKQGLAQILIAEVFKDAQRIDDCKITLEVRVSNYQARALYKKLGFFEEGIRKNYYQAENEDAIIMSKYMR